MTSLFFYSHVIVVERRLSKHEYELIIRGAMIGLTDGSPHLHQHFCDHDVVVYKVENQSSQGSACLVGFFVKIGA